MENDMADKSTPAPTPPPAPKLPLEDRIRALEADRKAGKPVPELDAAYREMDRLTDKGYKTAPTTRTEMGKGKLFKKGGSIKSSASRRADGIATKGKTKGRMI
jgi:hypothetical protein